MSNQVPEFVHEALQRKIDNKRASNGIIWGSINIIIIAVITLEIYLGGLVDAGPMLWWTIIFIWVICVMNTMTHIKSYLAAMLPNDIIEITEKQRNLLSVTDQDFGFKVQSNGNKEPKTPAKTQKLSDLFEATVLSSRTSTPNINGPRLSQSLYVPSPLHNTSYQNSTMSSSPERSFNMDFSLGSCASSASASSWSFHGNSSIMENSLSWLRGQSFNESTKMESSFGAGNRTANSPPVSPFSQAFRRSTINNKEELDGYLKDFKIKRRNVQILSQSESQTDGNVSFWSYSSPSSLYCDQLSSLKKTVYRVATKGTDYEQNSLIGMPEDSETTNVSSNSVRKVWQKRNISPTILFKYEENFRIWISMNILSPLVSLIDQYNESLEVTTPELKIGNVGIDKLRKAGLNISGMKQLNSLLPFLDMTLHQDYLVQRFRDLAKGGAMSAYQWNSGGQFNGQPWRDEFPTDSYIILHLFALYMDTHLPPDPIQPDGRVFSNVHLVKTPEKPPKPATYPCLYLTQLNSPHLKVILPGEEECEVGSGHKNCLHALLLFCHHVVYQEHSHIAGINLKLSGINLAWVVGSH